MLNFQCDCHIEMVKKIITNLDDKKKSSSSFVLTHFHNNECPLFLSVGNWMQKDSPFNRVLNHHIENDTFLVKNCIKLMRLIQDDGISNGTKEYTLMQCCANEISILFNIHASQPLWEVDQKVINNALERYNHHFRSFINHLRDFLRIEWVRSKKYPEKNKLVSQVSEAAYHVLRKGERSKNV